MKLPKWWKWEPASDHQYDAPIGASLCVVNEHGDVVATVREGIPCPWSFVIDDCDLHVECGGFATEAEAQRACERVYVAVTEALNAREVE